MSGPADFNRFQLGLGENQPESLMRADDSGRALSTRSDDDRLYTMADFLFFVSKPVLCPELRHSPILQPEQKPSPETKRGGLRKACATHVRQIFGNLSGPISFTHDATVAKETKTVSKLHPSEFDILPDWKVRESPLSSYYAILGNSANFAIVCAISANRLFAL